MARTYYDQLLALYPRAISELINRVSLVNLVEGRVKHLMLLFGGRMDRQYFDSIDVVVTRALAAGADISGVCGASMCALARAFDVIAKHHGRNGAKISVPAPRWRAPPRWRRTSSRKS